MLPTVGPATSGAATIGGTPSDVVSSMAGHWRCTSSTGSVSHRSYVVTDGGPVASGVSGSSTTRVAGGIRSSVTTPGGSAGAAPVSVARTVYGRQDGLDTGPFFERIVEKSDKTLTVQTPEGAGAAAPSDASSLRFAAYATAATPISEEAARGGTGGGFSTLSAARAAAPAQPISLSYSVEPSGLRRVARLGSQTLSDDRCTREVQTASAVCSTANAPAAAVHAVQPMSAQEGSVQMHLVLDDRGRVVGEDVLSSSSPEITQRAIMAARDTTFTAAVQDCRAVSSQQTFGVQFKTRSALSNGRETNL
ncbi:MAG: energy transducer TonB [Candidatus Eremiobacteraeota bacterium]|nr:energy transducer TonB [Candidatus Eremiobacteraeota bacterium]